MSHDPFAPGGVPGGGPRPASDSPFNAAGQPPLAAGPGFTESNTPAPAAGPNEPAPARFAAGPAPEGAGGPARRVAETDPDEMSAGPGFGGALGWTVLGTIIPGLGFWRAGRRVAGGITMGIFLLLIAGIAVLVATDPKRAAGALASSSALTGLALGLVLLAVVWVGVIAFSHLALRPPQPSFGQRAIGALVVGVLSFAVAAPMAFGANMAWISALGVSQIFDDPTGTDDTQPTINATDPWAGKPQLNILIIGGDSGKDRSSKLGDRTDTIIVASINTHTGATTLFTLPRNAARMPFPADSPLSEYYPNGFYDGVNPANAEYLLNAMYRNAPSRVPRKALGSTKDLGAAIMKVSVGEALGLDIDYFVKVNMDGFRDFIDAMGGITLNVNYRIPIGGQTDAGIPPEGYIEPGPNQHMSGKRALWYARGRYGLDDYKRMERQRCVVNAVVQQTTPEKVLLNFNSVVKAGEKTITTDVPQKALAPLTELGLKVKDTKLRSIVFDPDSGFSSSNPNWNKVKRMVNKAIKETEAGVETTEATTTPSASSSSSTTPKPTKKATAKAKSEDLDKTCAYKKAKS